MSRHRRRSLLLGLGAVLLAGAALDPGGGSSHPAATRVQVVMVRRAVPAGARIVAADLELASLTVGAVSASQLRRPSEAIGRRVAISLPAGAPLMREELGRPAAVPAARDVAVRLDSSAGIPEDDMGEMLVDVYLTVPGRHPTIRRVFRRVLVVASGARDGEQTATLRVPETSVPVLIAAEAAGSLRLAALGGGGAR